MDAGTVVLALAALLAVSGWWTVFRLLTQLDSAVSPTDQLIGAITEVVPHAYLATWLRSTVLNQTALDVYWQREHLLRIDELRCSTTVSRREVRLSVGVAGHNASTAVARSCPMMMFGESVVHFEVLPENHAAASSDGQVLTTMRHRPRLDLGQIHVMDLIFPAPVMPGRTFEIEQVHTWPNGMAAGENTLWYPYATMFSRSTGRLAVEVVFDHPVRYLHAVVADMQAGSCDLTAEQPRDTGARTRFEWQIDPVDNASIYGLVFDW